MIVRRGRADDTNGKAIKPVLRFIIIIIVIVIIDDIRPLPVANETAEAIYRVVDAAYEQRSIALSSNLHPACLDKLMPKPITNATADRLLHQVHVVLATGVSVRPAQATDNRGDVTDQPTDRPHYGRTPGHHRAALLAATRQLPTDP